MKIITLLLHFTVAVLSQPIPPPLDPLKDYTSYGPVVSPGSPVNQFLPFTIPADNPPQSAFQIGSCGENPGANETDLVAIPYIGNNFDYSFCGACYNVTGPNNQSRVVKVWDWWPVQPGTNNTWMLDPTIYSAIGCDNTYGCLGQIWWQLVPCPMSILTSGTTSFNSTKTTLNGNIVLDFNQWNNPTSIFVVPRMHRLAIYNMSYSDSTTDSPIFFDYRTDKQQCYFILDQTNPATSTFSVKLPLTLTLYAINGENVTATITGVPVAGSWPGAFGPGKSGLFLGQTISMLTSVQFTSNYPANGSSSPTIPTIPTTSSSSIIGVKSLLLFLLLSLTWFLGGH